MDARAAPDRHKRAMRLGAAAAVWSAGLVVAALVAPADSTSASSADGLTLGHATLVQTDGVRALVLTTIPLAVSAVVLATLWMRGSGARWAGPVAWTAIAVLAVETILGLMSIGLFIAPVPLLLAAAMRGRSGAGVTSSRRRGTSPPSAPDVG